MLAATSSLAAPDPDQIQALDDLLASLQFAPTEALTPEELIESSYLLSDCDDRITWLVARLDLMSADPDADQAAARELLDLIDAEIGRYGGRLPRDWSQDLDARRAQLTEPGVSPEHIVSRIKNEELFVKLPAEEQFALWSRGVSRDLLSIADRYRYDGRDVERRWDYPRTIVVEAASKYPPGIDWIERIGQLRAERDKIDREQERSLWYAYDVAEALLYRRLGFDQSDAARLAAPPSFDWSAAADQFQQDDLWIWAALALRLVQLERGGDVAPALAELDKARRVAASEYLEDRASDVAAISVIIESNAGIPYALPPFGDADREADRNAASGFAAQVVRAYAANQTGAGFEAIQSAKAASVGAIQGFTPITISQLKDMFAVGGRPVLKRLSVFVEMISIPSGTADAAYYAIVLVPIGSNTDNDRLFEYFIKADSVSDLMQKAIDAYRDTMVGQTYSEQRRGTEQKDCVNARFVIAGDIAMSPEKWSDAFARIGVCLKPDGWTVVTASAASLTDSKAWPQFQVMRYFVMNRIGAPTPIEVMTRYRRTDFNEDDRLCVQFIVLTNDKEIARKATVRQNPGRWMLVDFKSLTPDEHVLNVAAFEHGRP